MALALEFREIIEKMKRIIILLLPLVFNSLSYFTTAKISVPTMPRPGVPDIFPVWKCHARPQVLYAFIQSGPGSGHVSVSADGSGSTFPDGSGSVVGEISRRGLACNAS